MQALSPRRTLRLNTVRDVGLAKSPLTTAPFATLIGTLAQRSISSVAGAAPNVVSINATTSDTNSSRVIGR